jgi:hypothetical protein
MKLLHKDLDDIDFFNFRRDPDHSKLKQILQDG